MPTYAVEIGRILIRSKRPITQEDRRELVKNMLETGHFENVECNEETEVAFVMAEG